MFAASILERVIIKEESYIVGYHTQEFRYEGIIDHPIPCSRTNAWLGFGYYFWTNLDCAHYWGVDSKMKSSPTDKYDIYTANIEEDGLLNTVFDEEHYKFFVKKIDDTILVLKEKGVADISLLKVNRYLRDRIWKNADVDGVIFEDIPKNTAEKEQRYSSIPPLYYIKRIQIVAYNKKIINNFAILLEEQP